MLPTIITHGAIHGQMAEIMRRIEPIKKEREGGSGGFKFKFRGIYDVYAAVNSIMSEVGVYMTAAVRESKYIERESRQQTWLGHRIMVIEWAFRSAVDGTFVTTEVPTEGMDNNDKATFKGISASQKYAIVTTFLIPDEQAAQEPERDDYQPTTRKQQQPEISQESADLFTRYNTLLHEAIQKGVFGRDPKQARREAKRRADRAVQIMQRDDAQALTNLVVDLERDVVNAHESQVPPAPPKPPDIEVVDPSKPPTEQELAAEPDPSPDDEPSQIDDDDIPF